MNTTLPIVGSPSRIEVGSRCHRRHFAADVLCLKQNGRTEDALAVGTVIHAGAAENWRSGDVELAVLATREAYRQEEERMSGKFTGGVLEKIMRGYCGQAQLIPGDNGTFVKKRIVALEQRVVMDFGIEARLAFQLDRLVASEEPGGLELWTLVDTKSFTRADREWREQWSLSLQQKLYSVAIREQYKRRIDAHFIEGVAKKLPTEVLYVPLPDWDDDQLDEAVMQFRRVCQKDAKIVAMATGLDGAIDVDLLFELAVTHTEFNPHDCFAYHSPCPLLEVCNAPFAERVGLLKADFTHSPPAYLD